jgi:predicted DNA-binding protein (MmcQ/YjbR family)
MEMEMQMAMAIFSLIKNSYTLVNFTLPKEDCQPGGN